MENSCKKHFVLIHGACHGAWCWYKVKPLLEGSGHRVTVLDMAASGINHKNIHDLHTFGDHNEPLIQFMESIPDEQKVVLVGHSLGGINLAMTMEKFPNKIELAVFVAAFMPDNHHPPSFIFDQDFELAMALKRPSSLSIHDLSKPEMKLSMEKHGSVKRAYVICEEDQGISQKFQRWMIENYGLKEVKELKGSDHMPMILMPQQLADCLLEIA